MSILLSTFVGVLRQDYTIITASKSIPSRRSFSVFSCTGYASRTPCFCVASMIAFMPHSDIPRSEEDIEKSANLISSLIQKKRIYIIKTKADVRSSLQDIPI